MSAESFAGSNIPQAQMPVICRPAAPLEELRADTRASWSRNHDPRATGLLCQSPGRRQVEALEISFSAEKRTRLHSDTKADLLRLAPTKVVEGGEHCV